MKNELITKNIEQSYKDALIFAIQMIINEPEKFFNQPLANNIKQHIKTTEHHFNTFINEINSIPCTNITQRNVQYYHNTYAINKNFLETEFMIIWNKELMLQQTKNLNSQTFLLTNLMNENLFPAKDAINSRRIEELKTNFNKTPIIIGSLDVLPTKKILDGNHRVYAAKELGYQTIEAYVFDEIHTQNTLQSDSFRKLYEIQSILKKEIIKILIYIEIISNM